jgi:PqqD family protein of HPr-rel-A system
MSHILKTEVTLTDSGFLFEHSTGLTYSLNPTGQFIFRQLQEGKPAADILQSLTEEFSVSEDAARKDLDDYFRQLREMGLIG